MGNQIWTRLVIAVIVLSVAGCVAGLALTDGGGDEWEVAPSAMDQQTAEQYCMERGGYLTSSELDSKSALAAFRSSLHERLQSGKIWMAAGMRSRHLQWTGRTPGLLDTFWLRWDGEGPSPKPGRRCVALDLNTTRLSMEACDDARQAVCVRRDGPALPKDGDGRNMTVNITAYRSAHAGSATRESFDWVVLNSDAEFLRSFLQCDVAALGGKTLRRNPAIDGHFWLKDGVFLSHRSGAVLKLGLTRSTVSSREDFLAQQGSYACVTRVRVTDAAGEISIKQLTSPPVLVTMKNITIMDVLVEVKKTDRKPPTTTILKEQLVDQLLFRHVAMKRVIDDEWIGAWDEIFADFSDDAEPFRSALRFYFRSSVWDSILLTLLRKNETEFPSQAGRVRLQLPTLCGPVLLTNGDWLPSCPVGQPLPVDGALCHAAEHRCRWNLATGAAWELAALDRVRPARAAPADCAAPLAAMPGPCPVGYQLGSDGACSALATGSWDEVMGRCYGRAGGVVAAAEGLSWLPARRRTGLSPLVLYQPGTATVTARWRWGSAAPWTDKIEKPYCLARDSDGYLLNSDCDRDLTARCTVPAATVPPAAITVQVCSDGWEIPYNGQLPWPGCLRVPPARGERYTWTEAHAQCSAWGGRLARPRNTYENELLLQFALARTDVPAWIGDTSETPINIYSNFDPTQNQTESLLPAIDTNSRWLSLSKESSLYGFLCHKDQDMNSVVSVSLSATNSTALTLRVTNAVNISQVDCYANDLPLASVLVLSDTAFHVPATVPGWYWCAVWTDPEHLRMRSNELHVEMPSVLSYLVYARQTCRSGVPLTSAELDGALLEMLVPAGHLAVGLSGANDSATLELSPLILAHAELWPALPEDVKDDDSPNATVIYPVMARLALNSSGGALNARQRAQYDAQAFELLRDNLREAGYVVQRQGCSLWVSDSALRSTLSCRHVVSESNRQAGDVSRIWPSTLFDERALSQPPCMNDDGELLRRRCLGHPEVGVDWERLSTNTCRPLPDRTRHLLQLVEERPVDALAQLNNVTDGGELTATEIGLVAHIAADVPADSPSALGHLLGAVDSVMLSPTDTVRTAQGRDNSSTQLVSALSRATQTASQNSSTPLLVVGKAVAAAAWQLASEEGSPVGVKVVFDESRKMIEPLEKGTKSDEVQASVAIFLPEELRNASSPSAVSIVAYSSQRLFGGGDGVPVIQATVEGEKQADLSNPVNVLFRRPPDRAHAKPRCVAWDPKAAGGAGDWTQSGCQHKDTRGNMDTCQCWHLTSFSILFGDDDQSFEDRLALGLFTKVGCLLSMFSLSAVITTFCLFETWRKVQKQILFNLSLSLLALYTTFLVGFHRTDTPGACAFFGALTHYFIFSTFAWMLVKAVFLYTKLVTVVGEHMSRFMLKAAALAWLLPALPVVALLVYDPTLYSAPPHCWLASRLLTPVLVVPVAALVSVNATMFGLVMCSVARPAAVRCSKQQRSQVASQLRTAICLFLLLGVHWGTGLLVAAGAHVFFSYVFCAAGTLQGLFVFTAFVARDPLACTLWRRRWARLCGRNSAKTARSPDRGIMYAELTKALSGKELVKSMGLVKPSVKMPGNVPQETAAFLKSTCPHQ